MSSDNFSLGSIGDNSRAVPCQHIVDLEQLIKDIEMLATKTPIPKPCIFKIPQKLRDLNPRAYTPCRVAIGPYHANVEQLKSMEPHKLRYLDSLMLRSEGRSKLKDYFTAIEKIESEARKCYSDIEHLDSQKFKRILLLDGAFILEFLCKRFEQEIDRNVEEQTKKSQLRAFIAGSGNVGDPIFDNIRTRYEIRRDLILLENQLPFLTLEALFDCTFGSKSYNIVITLPQLAYVCLKHVIPIQASREFSLKNVEDIITSQERVMHLTHLMRLCCLGMPTPSSRVPQGDNLNNSMVPTPPRSRYNQGQGRYRISVTELHETGIHFKRVDKGKLIDIKFNEAAGVLRMPLLKLGENSEMFFRNVIAFEQYHLNKFQVTDYMAFMEGLIDTTRDVDILEGSQVIDNWLESKEDATTIFNSITKNTITDLWEYREVSQKLTAYALKPRNRWKAMLCRDYFGSPWAIISFIAAVVLLGLTALQTIAAVWTTKW